MPYFIAALIGSIANLMRGGRMMADKLPGRPALYVLAAGFVAVWIASSLTLAAVVVSGIALWAVPPWGRWYTLGHLPRDASGPPSRFERIIESIGGKSDHLCFLLRMALISPMFIVLGIMGSAPALILALFAPVLLALCYDMAWRGAPAGREIVVAEALAGLVIGLATMIAAAPLVFAP